MVDWSNKTWIGPYTPDALRRAQSIAAIEQAAAETTAAEQAAACGDPTGWRRHCRRHPYERRHSDFAETTAAEQAAAEMAEMASRPSRPRDDCQTIDYPWQFRELRQDMTDLEREQAKFWNLCLAQYIVQLWDDHERKRDDAVQ